MNELAIPIGITNALLTFIAIQLYHIKKTMESKT